MNRTVNLKGLLVDLSVARVMGILNITPDSFFAGSRVDGDTLGAQAARMVGEGADFLDVGGYSSRPGASEVSEAEELARVVPAIEFLAREFPAVPVSVDTFRARVAEEALRAGACMVNDISGGADADMPSVVARQGAAYVLMHRRGTPQTMQQLTHYENLLAEVMEYFYTHLATLEAAGVTDIIIDPGFGFAKTAEQNFLLLKHLEYFEALGRPLLAGLSRKSMVWRTLGITPDEALPGTVALQMVALQKGVSMLRVHDVREAKQDITLHQQLMLAHGNNAVNKGV